MGMVVVSNPSTRSEVYQQSESPTPIGRALLGEVRIEHQRHYIILARTTAFVVRLGRASRALSRCAVTRHFLGMGGEA